MNGQQKIETMFAFIATDKDGTEGIVAVNSAIGALPLIGADLDRVDSLRETAQQVATDRGIEIRLVHFSTRREIETLKPDKG